MRAAVLVSLVGSGLVVGVLGARLGVADSPYPVRAPANRSIGVGSGDLIALTTEGNQTHSQVVVIDPKTQVMTVYHINRGDGKISLRSVRNVHWDLQIDEWNGSEPSPKSIRSMLEQR